MTAFPLPPGSTIGILGGGQLGRMLALAAGRLGFDVAVLDPEAGGPASRVSAYEVVGAYDDPAALAELARLADVVTFEFENVPAAAVEHLTRLGVPVAPGARALAVAQDRVEEKTFLNGAGVATVAFAPADDAEAAREAVAALGAPALMKTRREGYDGKGQKWVEHAAEAAAAFEAVGGKPVILEAPADVSAETAAQAERIAAQILSALDYVGVIGIELFELKGGKLLVNEIAPRVHNTGHWTMDGCEVDQFEQQIRAVAGWPLGPTHAHSRVEMLNLLGQEAEAWAKLGGEPETRIHLYGKREATPGRKMGHVNRLRPL